MHTATILLVAVTLVQLLHSSRALTEWEFDQFEALPHTEQNTGLQGTVEIIKGRRRQRFFTLQSNGIPDHDTGIFPVPGGGNPHPIASQAHNKRIPKDPEVAKIPGCLPMGSIGFAKNGIPIFNALDSQGEDAVRGERFDDCNGHPNRQGTYHYHQDPVCLLKDTEVNDGFIGVALDGFPIYGNKDCNGNYITSADLDNCHGRYENGEYHYHITADFPYTLGCFKGELSQKTQLLDLLSDRCVMLNVTSNANVTVSLSCP